MPAKIFQQEGAKSIKHVAVRFDLLRYDAENDIRDRTSPENIEWANYIYDVIVAEGGITSTLKGYTADEDGQQVIVILEGRTRYFALKRAIEENKISKDIIDQHYIKVELVPRATPIVQMKEQMTAQYVKPLTPVEEYNGVAKLLALTAEDHKQVRKILNLSIGRYNAIIKVGELPKPVQKLVISKLIGLNNAHDFVKKYKGDPEQMVPTLQEIIDADQPTEENNKPTEETTEDVTLTQLMDEQPAESPTQPKAVKPKKKSKRDIDNALFNQLPEDEKEAMVGEVTDYIMSLSEVTNDLDGFEIEKIIELSKRILKRIEKDKNIKLAEEAAKNETPTIPDTNQGELVVDSIAEIKANISTEDVKLMNASVA